ncbi:hypothetical protein [uncultured Helicobacter sp.]|uniref:hypothetical protein n=1 Tax=uncultured Helicobacter sp. TaxID=175537 RepID=UPI003750F7BA
MWSWDLKSYIFATHSMSFVLKSEDFAISIDEKSYTSGYVRDVVRLWDLRILLF